MSTVAVKKVNDQEKSSLPIFQEIERRLDAARQRAFELFEGRGGEFGRDLEDWLRAEADVFGDAEVDVQEKAGQFEIHVTLDGFDPKQTEVTATPTEVAIHAERKDEQMTREVYRRFELSKPIRTDQVSAKLENGTLRIVAPCASRNLAEGGTQRTIAVA